MNWKIILSFAVTAIVSPIIVNIVSSYMLAKPTENLVYQELPSANFGLPANKISIRSVTITNTGKIPSKNVRIAISYQNGVKVQCNRPEFSSGNAANFKQEKLPQPGISFLIPSLISNERVTISCLSEGKASDSRNVSIKSDNSVGTSNQIESNNISQQQNDFNDLILQILIVLLALLFWFSLWISSLDQKILFLNRTAFTLIHQEIYDEALKILQNCLDREGANSELFANIAVCYAMLGKLDDAKNYIKAARFNNIKFFSKKIDGFIDFSEVFIVIIEDKDLVRAKDLFIKSINKYKDINKYIDNSSLIKTLRAQKKEVDDLFKNHP